MITIAIVAKVSLLFAVALLAYVVARRAAAATRHRLLAGAQLAALMLPLFDLIVPSMPIRFVVPNTVAAAQLTLGAEMALEPRAADVVTRSTPGPRWGAIAALLWSAGFAIVVVKIAVRLIRAARVVRRARRHSDFLLSDEIAEPCTFASSILLPRAALAWSSEEVALVLLHERAHVRRRDTLLTITGDLCCALYWFHPLAWIVARRVRLERERACDDIVLSRGVSPGDYATILIDRARVISRPTAAIPIAERSQLAERIRAIVDPRVRRRSTRFATLAIGVLTLIGAPLLAAVSAAAIVPRPLTIEPDLLGDAVASPFSERVEPAVGAMHVPSIGPDANFIAFLNEVAAATPRDEIDFVPERARWALSRVRDGQLVTPLLESLEDPDWRVRTYAAWTIGYSGDRRATQPLMAMLNSAIWRERAMAAFALSKLADRSAAAAMLDHLDDPAWQVRTAVVHYLRATSGSRAILEAMAEDRHIAVRTAAAEALEFR